MKRVVLASFILAFAGLVGGLDFDPNPDLVIYDHENVHNFGRSAAVCDINNDTHPDIVVGTGQGNLTVYVYYGGPLDRTPDLTIPVPTIGGYTPDDFGSKILCEGDFNGDGASDVVISDSINARNRAFVYFGGAGFDGEPDVNLTGYTAYNLFGGSLASGDLNHDGVDDLVVGASTDRVVFVFYGGASFNSIHDVQFSESASSFGLSVSAGADLNDDGIDDLVVGSYPGKVYVYYGSSPLDNASDVSISGLEGGAGYVVSSARDLNGDAVADMVVSGGSNTYVYYGGHDFDNALDLNISGVSAGSMYSLSSDGDVNNDGFADLAVAVSGSKVYVYYGGTQLDNVSDVNVSRAGITNFGRSMVSGDVNEDGVSDLVVGAGTWIFSGEKNRVFVYYGATSPLSREVHETWSMLNTPQPTVVTLQGKLSNSTTGAAITAASMRVTVTNSTGALVWQSVFDNAADGEGVFNIGLGAVKELKLVRNRVYALKVEVDLNSAAYSSADATFGDGNPAGDAIKFTA